MIRTRLLRKGLGHDSSDPVRIVEQWWGMDGTLLFEVDTWQQVVSAPGLRSTAADGEPVY